MLIVDDSAVVHQVLRGLLGIDLGIVVPGVPPDHARAPEALVIWSSLTEVDEPMSADALWVLLPVQPAVCARLATVQPMPPQTRCGRTALARRRRWD